MIDAAVLACGRKGDVYWTTFANTLQLQMIIQPTLNLSVELRGELSHVVLIV